MAVATSGLVVDLRARYANAGSPNSANATTSPWTDQSGNGYNGTLTNFNGTSSSGWQGTGSGGNYYCLTADGTNDYVDLGSNSALDVVGSSFTVEFWLKTSTATNFAGVADNGDSGGGGGNPYRGWYVDLSSGGTVGTPRLNIGAGASQKALTAASTVNDGNWHHVVFTYDKATTTGKVYIDGSLSNTNAAMADVYAASPDNLKLFGDGGSTNYLAGSIAQFRIYSTALDSTAVSGNYSAGADATLNLARTAGDTWSWSDSVVAPVKTKVQKWQGGRLYAADGAATGYIDSSKRLTEHGTASAASALGGVFYLADTGSGYTSYTLNGPAASNNGQTDVTVDDDVAVCLDAGSYASQSAASINVLLYQDANNWYRLEVAKTAGGTSTLYKKSGGTETSVATVSKGVAASSLARVQLYRNGGSALGIVVDGSAATYSDPSPLSGPFTVYLGAPATSSSSANRVDNIEVCYGTKVRVLGCPTGGGAAIYDAGGSLIASAAESSGIATLDLAGQQFPFTGYVHVCSAVSPGVVVKGDGRFPYSGTASFYGGDDFYYNPQESTGAQGLKALTASAEATYATTQTGSHNGVVVNGTTTYGVTLGFNGKVIAFSYNSDTGEYSENEIGSQSDMHSTCDVQADSSGVLHFVYGGSTHTQQTTKYRKSNTAWSITDLATETDLGERIRASLLVDSSDNLYLVGSRSNAASYDQMVCKKRSGGSWQSTVVIANADASWQLYPCDATLGRDGKIHGMWMAYSSGTGFEHAFHAKSTDGSTWTGITGTSLSLPLSQNSGTGKLSNSATLAADGDYGVSRLTVDSDGTVHAVIGRNSSTYAYFQGSSSTGWPASPTYTFTGTVYSNHGVIERFGNYLVYVIPSPVSGPSSSLYQTLTRWLSQDNGATWNTSTLFTNPTGGRAHFWWPKLTPITGSAYAKALWQGRGSVYSNMDGNSPLSGYGQSTLYLADVSVVLDVAAADSWAWSDTPSRQVAESRTAADTWAWSDSASQVLGHSSSTGTRTAADSWAWTDTAAGPRVTPATYPRTAADIWLWQDQVSRPVTPSPPEDPGYRLTFDIGPYL